MNFCEYCGNKLEPGTKICPSCGSAIPQEPVIVEAEPFVFDNGVQQTYTVYGENTADAQQAYTAAADPSRAAVVDSGSIGWLILGFLFPIVGWILYFVWKDKKPLSAQRAGLGGCIGFVFNLMVTFSSGMFI